MTNATQTLAVKQARHCPVCEGSSAELLFQQSFQSLDGIGLLDGFDLVVCRNCGMTFADRIPSQSVFDDYYCELSKYAYQHRGGKESPDDEWRLRQVAGSLESLIPNRATRLLEIGCANGGLLAILKEAGYQNVFGLDPSPDCAQAARNLYGATVFTGSIFAPPVGDHEYDFLVLLGVLEHIRDVRLAVRALRRIVTDSGHVYVEVPDATNLIAERDAPFQEFSTEHINYFSPAALSYLMEAAGFRTTHARSVVRPDRHGKPTAVVSAFFEKSTSPRTLFPRDIEAEAGLRRYIDKCREMEAALWPKISAAVAAAPRLIVWGVGTHTQRLLATGALSAANIVEFVDSNPKYQNQQLHGIQVVRPEALKGRTEPILISSCAFQKEIASQIREMNLPNKIILLYADSTGNG